MFVAHEGEECGFGRAALHRRDAAVGRERLVSGVDRDESAVVGADDARVDRQRNFERRFAAIGDVAIEILLVHEYVRAALKLGEGAEFEIDAVDRKSVVWGKSVSVSVDLGGRGILKKKKQSARK